MSTKTPEKRGPKLESGVDTLEKVTLSLDPMTREFLKIAGGGNESRGARVAARVFYDAWQRNQAVPIGDVPPLGPFRNLLGVQKLD